jgi:hypothetical protein
MWQRVTEHLAARRSEHRDRIAGGDPESRAFHNERSRLVESVGREAQRVVDTFDKGREANELADGARNAVAAAAAAGAGAVGLGTIVTIAATSAAADVTGIVMAGVIAALGFFIIPAKRSRAKEEMRQKISDVRVRLSAAMHAQFAHEIKAGLDRIRQGIAPYSRFVRAEGEKLTATEAELAALEDRLGALHARVEAL